MHYDYIIYIGRFQPFHNGHHFIIQQACQMSKKVMIFCGSSSEIRTLKNPFTYTERKTFILNSFNIEIQKKLYILPLYDYQCDNVWIQSIDHTVQKIVRKNKKIKIGLIGHMKDSTSYYLQLFKNWSLIITKNFNNINATYIRQIIFSNEDYRKIQKHIQPLISTAVLEFIIYFIKTQDYQNLSLFYISNTKKLKMIGRKEL